VKLWEVIVSPRGRRFVAVPAGDDSLLKKVVPGRYTIVDRRAMRRSSGLLRWTGSLHHGQLDEKGKKRADQRGMLEAWRRHVGAGSTAGIIVSPPRTGKCVTGDTLVRTDRGYETMEGLFTRLGHTGDVEMIGSFGSIQTPTGMAAIRGLYSRMSDSTITITTVLGTSITGTPEHPIQVSRVSMATGMPEEVPTWVPLRDVVCGDVIRLPNRTEDPVPPARRVGALTVSEARLIGILVSLADQDKLRAGIVDMDPSTATDPLEATSLLRSECGVDAVDAVVFRLTDEAPHLVGWRDALLASPQAAWDAFLATVDRETNTLETHDSVLAKAAHFHMLGSGVDAVMRKLDGEPWRVMSLQRLSDGPKPRLVADQVARVTVSRKPVRVYDVMIPDGKAFVTNGLSSHNTVLGVAATLAQKQRTIITASKIDFLRQFGMRFGELTNLRSLYREGLRPVVLVDRRGWVDGPSFGVHVVKKWTPEVNRADVVITPYQQLLDTDRGRERLRNYVHGRFGLLVADEIHQTGAPSFSRIINRSDARYRLGLTATPKRKDQLERVVHATLGQVVVKGKVTSDLPLLTLFETGVGSSRDFRNWNNMVSFLANSEERNKIITRQVFRDLREDPRNCVLLPVTRVAHIHQLVKMINAQAEFCRRNKDEDWPGELAVAYSGKSDTNAVLNQVRAGNARVVVAQATMVQHGLDIPRWTHVYIGVVPTSNPYLMYQLGNRVCTPYTKDLENELGDKPRPTVRFVIDAISASVFCFAKLFNDPDYGIKAGLLGTNYLDVKLYAARQEVVDRMAAIATMPRSYSPADAGVKSTLGVTRTGRRRRKGSWRPVRPVTRF
jgi:hypothetical protein